MITDRNGNILVSNAGTLQLGVHSARQIIALPERSGTFYGQKMVAGKKYVLAKGGGFQIAVDHAGNIVMADEARVRVLAEKTGRFYGLAMVLVATTLMWPTNGAPISARPTSRSTPSATWSSPTRTATGSGSWRDMPGASTASR